MHGSMECNGNTINVMEFLVRNSPNATGENFLIEHSGVPERPQVQVCSLLWTEIDSNMFQLFAV